MTEFVSIPCAQCKVVFGLTPETDRVLRQSSAGFMCPFGHPLTFPQGESEADKLRKERDRLKQNAAYLEGEALRLREERDAAERRVSAARGQVTRMKNRAANGLCPCCNRSFVNLRRHMASKHAGFLAEEVQAEAGQTIQ